MSLQRSQTPAIRVQMSGVAGPFTSQTSSDAHRVVYRYSVIPGGVENREELQQAIRSDRVVADHYRRFDSARAYRVTLQNARAVHVSYRVNDVVYWTKKTVSLPRGEQLVTDGDKFARTRCGNQVSVEPQEPTHENEPSSQDLLVEETVLPVPPVAPAPPASRTTTVPAEPPPVISVQLPPVPPEAPPVFPNFIPPSPPGIPIFIPLNPPPPPRHSTPEPSTLVLVGSGLLVWLIVWRLSIHNRR